MSEEDTQVHVDLHCYALCRYKCIDPKNIPNVEQALYQAAEPAVWSQKDHHDLEGMGLEAIQVVVESDGVVSQKVVQAQVVVE